MHENELRSSSDEGISYVIEAQLIKNYSREPRMLHNGLHGSLSLNQDESDQQEEIATWRGATFADTNVHSAKVCSLIWSVWSKSSNKIRIYLMIENKNRMFIEANGNDGVSLSLSEKRGQSVSERQTDPTIDYPCL